MENAGQLQTLEEQVVSLLQKKNYHISFAESCTGGLCSARLVSVASASAVFDAGVVTYANEAKIKYLGVKPEIIESYGVGGIPDVYLDELDALIQKGKTIIMATQVTQEGSDIKVYEVGERLKTRYGLLETYDITLESAVTKLMWAMGRSEDPAEIRKLFCTSINYDLLF